MALRAIPSGCPQQLLLLRCLAPVSRAGLHHGDTQGTKATAAKQRRAVEQQAEADGGAEQRQGRERAERVSSGVKKAPF